MMKHSKLTVLIERDEDGYYVADVPVLRSCYTQARSLPVMRKRIAQVIKLCLAHQPPTNQEIVAIEQMEIPA